MDPNLPLADIQTMEQITATALAAPRFAAWLLGLFAALALTLAAIGTYATISLLVTERAHEIGIRIALGAERRTILGWILGEGVDARGRRHRRRRGRRARSHARARDAALRRRDA